MRSRQVPLKIGVRDAILSSSLTPVAVGTSLSDARVWRWLPWLLSFTGANIHDLLAAKGEDFLDVLSVEAREIPILRLRSPKSRAGGVFALPYSLVDMGLLDVAKDHRHDHLFVPDDRIGSSERAMSRYRARLKRRGLLDGMEGRLVSAFRLRLQDDLRRVGTAPSTVDAIMGRAVRHPTFYDDIGIVLASAEALDLLEMPAYR